MNSATIVQKLWNYCNVLRDDGMSYGDYVEQLTYLLFLKMADERSKPPFNLTGESPSPILKGYDWPSLLAKDGDELFDHYRHTLEKLGAEKGTIGLIFAKALNKFQDPAKLRRLVVDLIDGENWSAMGADVKGDAYEGLLEKNAQDTKSGAGQYFTPRPLIQAMVDCIAPKPGETVCDPACGTGGFLFAAHNHVADHNPSRHLALMLEGGLLDVESKGRTRHYRIANSDVACMIESMAALAAELAADRSPLHDLQRAQHGEFRQARTCYDHFAGRLGVELLQGILAAGWLEPDKSEYRMTTAGELGFEQLGVDIPRYREQCRVFARPCTDISEREPHLGGALGAAMVDACVARDFVVRSKYSRVVTITPSGWHTFRELGLIQAD